MGRLVSGSSSRIVRGVAGDRGAHGQAAHKRQEDRQTAKPIGHATDTRPESRLLKITDPAKKTLTRAENQRAGDGNRTRMTSLEGVWRTGVSAAELETLMLLSSRGCPLITVANGPVMARRSWPILRQAAIRPSVFQAGHIPSCHRSCVCSALSPVAGASRWLLLLSPLLSTPSQAVRWKADRYLAGDGPRPVRASSRLALVF